MIRFDPDDTVWVVADGSAYRLADGEAERVEFPISVEQLVIDSAVRVWVLGMDESFWRLEPAD